jgi:hypothetical protein
MKRESLGFEPQNKAQILAILTAAKIAGVLENVEEVNLETVQDYQKYNFIFINKEENVSTASDRNLPQFFSTLTTSFETFVDYVLNYKNPIKIEVKLNDEYTASYTQGDTIVKVGCQQIPVSKIQDLCNQINNLLC